MDTAQWPQEIVVKPLEEIVTNTRGQKEGGGGLDVRKSRAQKEQAVLNCPRCNSANTKFCYYNNYSLTQPRYFCKTCRRYWTEGGSLRNIPVGGGSRKNKRSNSNISNSHTTTTTSSSSIITKNTNIMMMTNSNKLPDLVVAPPTLSTTNPKIHEAPITSHDLNLAFPRQDFRTISDLVQDKTHMSSSALELLTGITNSRGFTSFMPTTSVQDPNSVSSLYTNGFSLQEFKPSLGFSLDGLGSSSYGGGEGGGAGGGGRLLFPFEDLMKQAPSSGNNNNNNSNNNDNGGGEHDHHHHDHNQQSRDQQADHISTGGGGYWTGMLGGGNW